MKNYIEGKLCLGTFGEQLTELKRDADEQERICSNGDCQRTTSVNVEEHKTININMNALTLKGRVVKKMWTRLMTTL